MRDDYVAVLSGNTDLLEKARLDKKITTLESERKNFLRERDAATGKLAEIESSVSFHSIKSRKRRLTWLALSSVWSGTRRDCPSIN